MRFFRAFSVLALASLGAVATPDTAATPASPGPRKPFPTSLTLQTEAGGENWCRKYADGVGALVTAPHRSVPFETTCWTRTNMPDVYGEGPQNSTVYLWLVNATGVAEAAGVRKEGAGAGNVEQGRRLGVKGIADEAQDGCWLNEDYVAGGDTFVPEDQLDWCGPAPQHQVAWVMNKLCYSCTWLDSPDCVPVNNATMWQSVLIDMGCWKEGTAVDGNSTWVKLKDADCYVPPGQIKTGDWAGNPAGKCDM